MMSLFGMTSSSGMTDINASVKQLTNSRYAFKHLRHNLFSGMYSFRRQVHISN